MWNLSPEGLHFDLCEFQWWNLLSISSGDICEGGAISSIRNLYFKDYSTTLQAKSHHKVITFINKTRHTVHSQIAGEDWRPGPCPGCPGLHCLCCSAWPLYFPPLTGDCLWLWSDSSTRLCPRLCLSKGVFRPTLGPLSPINTMHHVTNHSNGIIARWKPIKVSRNPSFGVDAFPPPPMQDRTCPAVHSDAPSCALCPPALGEHKWGARRKSWVRIMQ